MCVCHEGAGEKELPLSYLFVDDDDSTGSDATALIYKLHTSDNIKFVKHSLVLVITVTCKVFLLKKRQC